ncbi:hypothetical protein FF098_015900 [Parvularcula flava]|uniref:Uncharacterized protein n=1 Tax=Aquisalinus luteolus TaxID=1566827 RepID=A0A8J3A4X8_9PROT|nr:hypothetical protein [Aquisalinus luteolus]NHK29399.1 hypothetical protein [Aquisalinus luteolus]GGI02067.1 hypothetical protein GCM10011355_34200 [Aquisalinus luteolus]
MEEEQLNQVLSVAEVIVLSNFAPQFKKFLNKAAKVDKKRRSNLYAHVPSQLHSFAAIFDGKLHTTLKSKAFHSNPVAGMRTILSGVRSDGSGDARVTRTAVFLAWLIFYHESFAKELYDDLVKHLASSDQTDSNYPQSNIASFEQWKSWKQDFADLVLDSDNSRDGQRHRYIPQSGIEVDEASLADTIVDKVVNILPSVRVFPSTADLSTVFIDFEGRWKRFSLVGIAALASMILLVGIALSLHVGTRVDGLQRAVAAEEFGRFLVDISPAIPPSQQAIIQPKIADSSLGDNLKGLALSQLGLAYIFWDIEEAKEHAEAAVISSPDQIVPLFRLLIVHVAENDLVAASSVITKLRELDNLTESNGIKELLENEWVLKFEYSTNDMPNVDTLWRLLTLIPDQYTREIYMLAWGDRFHLETLDNSLSERFTKYTQDCSSLQAKLATSWCKLSSIRGSGAIDLEDFLPQLHAFIEEAELKGDHFQSNMFRSVKVELLLNNAPDRRDEAFEIAEKLLENSRELEDRIFSRLVYSVFYYSYVNKEWAVALMYGRILYDRYGAKFEERYYEERFLERYQEVEWKYGSPQTNQAITSYFESHCSTTGKCWPFQVISRKWSCVASEFDREDFKCRYSLEEVAEEVLSEYKEEISEFEIGSPEERDAYRYAREMLSKWGGEYGAFLIADYRLKNVSDLTSESGNWVRLERAQTLLNGLNSGGILGSMRSEFDPQPFAEVQDRLDRQEAYVLALRDYWLERKSFQCREDTRQFSDNIWEYELGLLLKAENLSRSTITAKVRSRDLSDHSSKFEFLQVETAERRRMGDFLFRSRHLLGGCSDYSLSKTAIFFADDINYFSEVRNRNDIEDLAKLYIASAFLRYNLILKNTGNTDETAGDLVTDYGRSCLARSTAAVLLIDNDAIYSQNKNSFLHLEALALANACYAFTNREDIVRDKIIEQYNAVRSMYPVDCVPCRRWDEMSGFISR